MWDTGRIVTVGAVVLSLIVLLSLPPSFSSALKIKTIEVLAPAQRSGYGLFSRLGMISAGVGRVIRAGRVNRDLEDKLELLSRRVVRLREVERENSLLRELLKLKRKGAFQGIAARVIGRDVRHWYQSVLVDKGLVDGVRKESAVVSGQGVVGKVIEAAPHSSRVLLLVDQNSRVGGVVQDSRLSGIVGGFSTRSCRINYLPRRSRIEPGELVLTSGLGRIYPPGLLIGTISKVYPEKFGLYQYADLEPATDFDRLEEVLVLPPVVP